MVHHSLVSMGYSQLAQRLVAREVCGVEENFEVHHVVNDHLEDVRIRRVQTARAANDRAESCG